MQLVTYQLSGGQPKPGAVRDNEVIDLSGICDKILDLVADTTLLDEVRKAAAEGQSSAALADVQLLAPIPRPGHIYCVGWNYPKHYEEGIGKRSGQETDERKFATFFSKPNGSVIGHGDAIAWDPAVTTKLDYEGELAVVIGQGGRSISEESARNHVFGYTLANDITARDIQRRHGGQWQKGKGMDTYCPMGPVLVTADALDERALTLRSLVNGEVRQEASTGTLFYPVERIIAQLSLGMTLEPGDVILTGTPSGVGFAHDPPLFLEPGDVTEVEIAEIGRLVNRVEEIALT
jgi:2-keto-4-pentenoate hydratase/2-oxohepta-3-ene-1,7-dioic acid hydratase in catechol pathway